MAKPDKPTPILDLDVIDAEHEKKAAEREPFVVKAGGKEIHFKSVEDLEWETVEDLRKEFDARQFLYATIEDDDELNLFFEQGYKAATLESIMRSYYDHFGLTVPGDARLNRAARRKRR